MGIFDEGEKEVCAVRHNFLFCFRFAAHEYTSTFARDSDDEPLLNKFRKWASSTTAACKSIVHS